MARVKTLIVDDSATMRALLASTLKQHPDIEVVGTACDPYQARTMIKALNPDVLTLDVEMPGMNGLEFLEKIMRLRPMPVIMVSTLTQKGAAASIEAMRLGAVDCFPKPTANMDAFREAAPRLATLIRQAAQSRVRAMAPARAQAVATFDWNGKVAAIGSSTGGVEALFQLLGQYPSNCPPTLIVQHIQGSFSASFARSLNDACPPTVVEAEDRMPVLPGHVYVAPGSECHMVLEGWPNGRLRLIREEPFSGHRPSVDIMFRSVAKSAGNQAAAAILTGMGRDGARGLGMLRAAGALTLGQNRETCVVYGMPKAAQEAGALDQELPLEEIAPRLLKACGRHG